MDYSRIPEELKELNQWVCAWEGSKAPMKAFERGAASSTDPNTWSFFEQAEWAVQEEHYDYIGFVFNNNGIVGIDIDCGFEDGLMTPLCCDIVGKCKSYTEKSKSGRGVHILLHGTLPFDGKNNLKGVEIYKTGRYFITTGNVIVFDKIEDNQAAIDYVVEKYFSDVPEARSEGGRPLVQRIYAPVFPKPVEGKIRLRPDYPEIIPGGRNISLTSLAGAMHNTGYTVRQIYEELQHVNRVACNPPLPDRELRTIAESISRYRRD